MSININMKDKTMIDTEDRIFFLKFSGKNRFVRTLSLFQQFAVVLNIKSF